MFRKFGKPCGSGGFYWRMFFSFVFLSRVSLVCSWERLCVYVCVCVCAYISFKPSESCSFSYWFIKSEFLGISLSCQISYDSAERGKKNTTCIGKILSCVVQLSYLKMTDEFSSWMLVLLSEKGTESWSVQLCTNRFVQKHTLWNPQTL